MTKFEQLIEDVLEADSITKSTFKKAKRKKEIRKKRHIRLSPAQKRGLKKAQRKSHTGSAKRKAKRTKKVRGRKGIYNSVEAILDRIINEEVGSYSYCKVCGFKGDEKKCPTCGGQMAGKSMSKGSLIRTVVPGGMSTGT